MTAIVALVGPAAVAGYGIGMRYVALVFLPALGLAQGTEAAVGQNVGAGDPDRARRATLLSVGLVAAIMAFGGAGHSRKALGVGLFELVALRVPIPLALLFLGFGASSVWYGMTVAIVGGALFGGAWFLTGTWQGGGRNDPTATPTDVREASTRPAVRTRGQSRRRWSRGPGAASWSATVAPTSASRSTAASASTWPN
jgi:Na+-driven multidrug efflux pump